MRPVRQVRNGSGDFQGSFRQKKAQPARVALKVPPKEEVLEELRRLAPTQEQYPTIRDVMQAFAAALQDIWNSANDKSYIIY